MGLLAKIESLKENKTSGLLAKASQMEFNKSTLSQWARANSVRHIAIFSQYNNFYYISDSLNIDARTIALSVSTKDFWQGSIDFDKQEYVKFSKADGNLGRFYQFFREDLRHDVEELNFLPFTLNGQSKILMILKKQDEVFTLPEADEKFVKSLSLINFNISEDSQENMEKQLNEHLTDFQANLYILSYRICLESLFGGIEISSLEIKKLVIESMTKVMHSKITQLFANPNLVYMGTSEEIKIIYIAKDDIDENLLLGHLKNCLKGYLGNKESDSLLLLNAGVTKIAKGAMAFLING